MVRVIVLSLLLLQCGPRTYAYCPTGKRFDVQSFPPRCMNCSRIVSNEMHLTPISTQLGIMKNAVKFSPGLPQNRTCGCWRTGNRTVDVYLNASTIVAGLFFGVSSQVQWVKEFSVQASNDNVTFLPWGTYTQDNYTTAQTVLFGLPIRASSFRLSITKYANHYLNGSSFGIAVSALSSNTQPFSCGCPVLPSGECCPYMNMTVKDGKCEWCKDPMLLNVVVINECGVCKNGTIERDKRCVPMAPVAGFPPLGLYIGNISISASRTWRINVLASGEAHSMYLRPVSMSDHPCQTIPIATCLDRALPADYVVLYSNRSIVHSYLRGATHGLFVLEMSSSQIQLWTECPQISWCTGVVGVAYTVGEGFVKVIERRVQFNLWIVPPPFATVSKIDSVALPLAAEVHVYQHAAFLRMDATDWMLDGVVSFQCAHQEEWLHVNVLSDPMWMLQLPRGVLADPRCTRFRVKGRVSANRDAVVAVDRPATFVYHERRVELEHAPIRAELSFGLARGRSPLPGDSERLITVRATSEVPMQFNSMSVTRATGESEVATKFQDYVLNMTHACAATEINHVRLWLLRYLDLILDNGDVARVLQNCCVEGGQMMWIVVPAVYSQNRKAAAPFAVSLEFGMYGYVSIS
jgi:hypothetical protein